MRLRIRAVQLRVQTPSVLCGADLQFNDGLVVFRAENSSGKSTVVQSIIYALGLEGMLSASHEIPLPHVMTDSIEVGTEKMPVIESAVAVEVENASGKIATVFRGIKGPRNKNLISVVEEAALTNPTPSLPQTDYYVREGGAAVNQRGFHHWFAAFAGWNLPKVGRVDGTECPLYVECVFPLMIIEQKRGWSAIQARMPFHYRIRDVAKKSTEFLLALEGYEVALKRQKLREEALAIRLEWNREAMRVLEMARSVNAVVQNLDPNLPVLWEADELPLILASRNGNWQPYNDAVRADIDELQRLEQTDIPRIEHVAHEAEAVLNKTEGELSEAEFTAAELFREIEKDQQQIYDLNERLTALDEDERRNRDVAKLKRMGSVENIAVAHGKCPTCHQAISDALLPQMERREPMTVEDNLKLIRGQIDTFSKIKDAAVSSLTAKQLRLDSVKQQISDLRGRIRVLRQTLVTEGNQLSVEMIEKRLRLRESVESARRIEEQISSEFEAFRRLGRQWKQNQDALDLLPKGDLTDQDRQKLRRFRELFVAQLAQFGFSSVAPGSLQISEENYRPEHDGFDLEFDISASDMIRTIWAYLNGMLELAREFSTNHLGLLVLDEPKQQETARVSFRELFRRVATSPSYNQQVIIATSEDEATLLPLLSGIKHQYISFPGRIVRPLEPTVEPAEFEDIQPESHSEDDEDEMIWETEARYAVENALETMDFDAENGVIEVKGFNGESMKAHSREELEQLLRSIASDAWTAYVPFDGGEATFECDEWGIVENAIEPYAAQIDEFYSRDE